MSQRVYHLVIWPEAEVEITDAVGWYESQVDGLGREFLRAFRAVVAVLRRSPLHHQVVVGNVRRALLRRFPYAVLFEVHGSDLVVLACLHTARDPEEWQSRIGR